jgi:ectoine hydroxylase
MYAPPSADEFYFFETYGYLVLDSLLQHEHVAALRLATERAISDRRHQRQSDEADDSRTTIEGANTRIFHILEDDPLFLELVDFGPVLPYVRTLLCDTPHFHASDAIWDVEPTGGKPGWHMDGKDGGFRSLRPGIPLLQLKVGYFLSDMTEPNQGNLMIVPASHRTDTEPEPEHLQGFDSFPGAMQLCVAAGSCVLFHNALWHTKGPSTLQGGARQLLYFAYEHPWMVANPEHWSYSKEFYRQLDEGRRAFFHGFVFDPPEQRWS